MGTEGWLKRRTQLANLNGGVSLVEFLDLYCFFVKKFINWQDRITFTLSFRPVLFCHHFLGGGCRVISSSRSGSGSMCVARTARTCLLAALGTRVLAGLRGAHTLVLLRCDVVTFDVYPHVTQITAHHGRRVRLTIPETRTRE